MSVRGIDLSVAQVADAAGVLTAFLILNGTSAVAAVGAGLGLGLIVGVVNAVFNGIFGRSRINWNTWNDVRGEKF